MAHFAQSRNVIRHVVSRGTALHKSENAIHHPLLFACQGVRYRKLEVILTTGIEKLGKGGETVKVAPGYFRNHLMPKLLAVPNIDKYAHLIREQRKMRNYEEKEEVKVVHKSSEVQTKEFEKAAKRLANANLVLRKLIDKEKFKNRSSKEDKPDVQTPVTKEEILSEVARQLCVKIEPDNVVLTEPLTTFGEYEVPLKFPKTIPMPPGTVQWILKVKPWNCRSVAFVVYINRSPALSLSLLGGTAGTTKRTKSFNSHSLACSVSSMVSSITLLPSATLLTNWANLQLSSQSGLSPRYSTWQCVCFRDQKRKLNLYIIPARHHLLSTSSMKLKKIHATSGVSQVQSRSTHSNEMKEFEIELQELFNEVKAMVKIGKERDAMDLLRANYVAVKEEIDSGLKGIQQAALLDIIALAYMAVGDLKPVPALLDMISKIVDKLRDSEPLLDSVLMHVGSMYSALGMFENALLAHQRAVSILENTYGDDNTLLVTPLLGLAKSYGSYGKANKAIDVYKRTVTILERNRGSESEDLVVPLFSLGKLLLKEGKADEAEVPFTRILNIYKKTYGEKDGRVGMAMCSLANAKCTKGDANEAVDLYKKALRIIEESNYMDIDNTVLENIRIDLAELLHFVGRGNEGRELLEECLLINEKYKVKNNPSMATHLMNLAASYSRSKNYVEAERLLRTCLDIMEQSVGSEDQSITFPMLDLAVTLSQLNRYEEAEQVALEVLRIREKAFGKESLPVGEALDCLVSIQVRLGRDDGEVLSLLKRVLMIQEKEFGPSAEELIITLQKIVHMLDKLEMKDEKFKFRRRLALLRERYKQSLGV
ncbi:hypothetical protein HA466_0178290 [Hirschfeldia incana]|nr:hypothetical protein HA466_0178290 [Hirschfeldia incana]